MKEHGLSLYIEVDGLNILLKKVEEGILPITDTRRSDTAYKEGNRRIN
ncbi:MAG: hypothetical protein WBI07_12155 [Mobilitalea sp.]